MLVLAYTPIRKVARSVTDLRLDYWYADWPLAG